MNNTRHIDASHSLQAGLSADRMPLGRDFLHLSKTFLGSTQPPVEWIKVRFPGGKAPGPWR